MTIKTILHDDNLFIFVGYAYDLGSISNILLCFPGVFSKKKFIMTGVMQLE